MMSPRQYLHWPQQTQARSPSQSTLRIPSHRLPRYCPRHSCRARANRGRVTVAEPAAKTTSSAAKVLSPTIPAPSPGEQRQSHRRGAPAKTTPSTTKVLSPPIPAPGPGNHRQSHRRRAPCENQTISNYSRPNQTLQDICVRYLGICDLKRLHEIQALNPNLTDLDHIQAGQKLWLPAPEPAPIAQPSTAQAHLSPPPGASSNAIVSPSAATVAVRNPAGGNRGAAESPRAAGKVANTGLPSVTAGGGSYGKVASAGIPGVVKGTATPKIPVAPVPAEMIPKPTESSNPALQSTPNCGGPSKFPCPKLQTRPTSPPD